MAPRRKPRRTKPKRGPHFIKNQIARTGAFIRAHQLHRLLVITLGNACAHCGESNATLLTIDHVKGITWDRLKLRYDRRINKYLDEYSNGIPLRVLCLICNGRYGRPIGVENHDDSASATPTQVPTVLTQVPTALTQVTQVPTQVPTVLRDPATEGTPPPPVEPGSDTDEVPVCNTDTLGDAPF